MGVASWSLLSGPLYGSGPAGGCSSRKAGRLVLWFPACVVGAGVVGCLVLGVGNTPVVLLLPACVGSGVWWVPLRVWGWHAVGVLGQCALVAWPVWGSWLLGVVGLSCWSSAGDRARVLAGS